jgi:hypothetical protein
MFIFVYLIGFQSKSGASRKRPFKSLFVIFFEILISTIPEAQASRMCVKCCLVCDLEDLDFPDLELPQTRQHDFPVQSGVVGGSRAKGSGTDGVCVAVVGNTDVTPKAWTARNHK